MLRDAVSRTANVERNGGEKWVKIKPDITGCGAASMNAASGKSFYRLNAPFPSDKDAWV